jgi:hypothetical protein
MMMNIVILSDDETEQTVSGTIVRWHYSVRVRRAAALNLEG